MVVVEEGRSWSRRDFCVGDGVYMQGKNWQSLSRAAGRACFIQHLHMPELCGLLRCQGHVPKRIHEDVIRLRYKL